MSKNVGRYRNFLAEVTANLGRTLEMILGAILTSDQKKKFVLAKGGSILQTLDPRIHVFRPDPCVRLGSVWSDRIRVVGPDPCLQTGYVCSDRLRVVGPDPCVQTGSVWSARIRVLRPKSRLLQRYVEECDGQILLLNCAANRD